MELPTLGFEGGTLSYGLDVSSTGDALSQGSGTSVVLWDLSLVEEATHDPNAAACRVAGRGLTAQEWEASIGPGFEFEETCA